MLSFDHWFAAQPSRNQISRCRHSLTIRSSRRRFEARLNSGVRTYKPNMSHATSRRNLITSCIDAIKDAEALYSKWTDGITMRSAPESLVQMKIAENLAKSGDVVFLEASVKDIMSLAIGEDPPDLSRGDRGRIDIAVYYNSKGKRACPRFVVEVKKLTTHHSLDQDHARIRELLKLCPDIQNGIMIGYGTAVNAETALRKVLKVTEHLPCKRVRTLDPMPVTGRDKKPRYLAAGVFRVERE